MKMFIVEGNIGAGKSTLTKELADVLNARAFYEPVEENPYLDKYYSNPKKYALPMQFFLMSHRYEMHRKGIEHIWRTGQSCIFDRSIYGDFIFAKKNWIDGNMSELDYENYNKMRKVMFKTLMVPHVTIYLNSTPEISLKNINARSRDCESTIPLEYLTGLHNLYKELMLEMKDLGSQVVDIDWSEFKPISHVIDEISKVTKQNVLDNTSGYEASHILS